VQESIVLSHRKDADGIASAALVRSFSGAKVYLADYGEMVATISKIEPATDIYICDLGLNRTMFDAFEDQLRRLSKSGRVHYIDHHPISEEFSARLTGLGIDVFHSTEESAAMLVFKKYGNQLAGNAKILACCGAITDYLDDRPLAKKLISTYDRQFLLYEATVLSFTVAMIGRGGVSTVPQLVEVVEALSAGKLPHEIDGAAGFAKEFAGQSARLIEKVRRDGVKMKNFAYFMTSESSTGNIANFLMGAFDVPVGLAFRSEDPGFLEVSARASEEFRGDLGKIIARISNSMQMPGGGHPRAAGTRIPEDQLQRFLQEFESSL
jgi:archaea-specific RecJ-like exonuclease